jgi:hypothetical protein
VAGELVRGMPYLAHIVSHSAEKCLRLYIAMVIFTVKRCQDWNQLFLDLYI